METNTKLFFNSQSLRNLLQKDQIHMKGLKTTNPIADDRLVKTIIYEEIGNQQSEKMLKTLRKKKEREERKRQKAKNVSPSTLLQRAIDGLMINHNIFQYCNRLTTLPSEDITFLEQNYPRIKDFVAPIFYKLRVEYEELSEIEPNVFEALLTSYSLADPHQSIRKELQQFLSSPVMIQLYDQYYKAPKFINRVYEWIWKRLLITQLLIALGRYHHYHWKQSIEEYERRDYRRIIAANNHETIDLASTASNLLKTYTSSLGMDQSSSLTLGRDYNLTEQFDNTGHDYYNEDRSLVQSNHQRPISNPELQSHLPPFPSIDGSSAITGPSNTFYSQSAKQPLEFPKILDKKTKQQYGFDESYARSTPRALQSQLAGMRNNHSTTATSSVVSTALPPMNSTSHNPLEQIEMLRRELYISQLGIQQLNKVVDENITWVQNHCEITDKHLYLSRRAKEKCQKLATQRIYLVLLRWYYRTKQFTFHHWRLAISYQHYNSLITQYSRQKSLVGFRKVFVTMYLKLVWKRWIQWFQRVRMTILMEKTAAVIQIQRIVRGFLGRHYCVREKVGKAASSIQGLFRIIQAKKKVEDVKKFRSAVFASLIIRRFVKRLIKVRQAKQELAKRKNKKAASKIQALFRGQHVRQAVIPEILKQKEEEAKRQAEQPPAGEGEENKEGGIDGGDLEKVALKAASPKRKKKPTEVKPRRTGGYLAATSASNAKPAPAPPAVAPTTTTNKTKKRKPTNKTNPVDPNPTETTENPPVTTDPTNPDKKPASRAATPAKDSSITNTFEPISSARSPLPSARAATPPSYLGLLAILAICSLRITPSIIEWHLQGLRLAFRLPLMRLSCYCLVHQR